jgi:hypothetical protein
MRAWETPRRGQGTTEETTRFAISIADCGVLCALERNRNVDLHLVSYKSSPDMDRLPNLSNHARSRIKCRSLELKRKWSKCILRDFERGSLIYAARESMSNTVINPWLRSVT